MSISFRPSFAALLVLAGAAPALAARAPQIPATGPGPELPFEPTPPTDLTPRVRFEHPVYQVDGDRLWVRGRDYKAAFGAEGASYIPFLGSDAPRNFPVKMRLASAELGGRALELSPTATWNRDGDVVTLDRGPVQVRYHIGADSIEQTFVLDALPEIGELVVHVEFDSELELAPAAEGFQLSGDFGGVHYGSATVLDAFGASLAVESRVEERGLAIHVPQHFVESARLPLVVDPIIRTHTLDDSAGDSWAGDVAYDAKNGLFGHAYTFVYSQNDLDILFDVRDEDGNYLAGPSHPIDLTTESWLLPSIAGNHHLGRFEVVAQVHQGPVREIWHRGVQLPDGSQSAKERISAPGIDCDRAWIGGDGNDVPGTRFCVAWSEDIGGNAGSAVRYRMLNADGSLAGPTRLIEETLGVTDRHVHVSEGNGYGVGAERAWNIVWERLHISLEHDIWGARVGASGQLVSPTFSVDSSPGTLRNPRVSAPLDSPSGGLPDYLVVYQKHDLPNIDLHARMFKGNLLVGSYDLTQMIADQVGDEHLDLAQIYPSVATDGSQFLVAYAEAEIGSGDGDVFVTSFAHLNDDLVVTEAHVLASGGIGANTLPRIVSGHDSGHRDSGTSRLGWLNLETPQSDGDTLGAIYVSPRAYRSIGDVTCGGMPNSTGFAATFRAFGSRLANANALWLDVDNLPSFQWGQFVMGQNQTWTPIGSGFLCVGAPQIRLLSTMQNSWLHGTAGTKLDLWTLPQGTIVQAGDTWHLQFWYRDAGTSNFSNALSIQFE